MAVNSGGIDQFASSEVEDSVAETDNEQLLKDAYETSNDAEVQMVIRDRLHELDASVPEGETTQGSLSGSEDNQEEQDAGPSEAPQEDPASTESVSGTTQEKSIQVGDLAPSAMTPDQASESQHKWRVMVWGRPSVGKSHFAYTMPSPVCILDTEGKADDIAHKFDEDFYIWQPEGYDEAKEGMEEAFDVLDAYREQTGQIGTLVVDSMSIMWTWAQQKYVDKYKDDDDLEEAREDFQTGFGSGESDWQKIKEYHGPDFRRQMLNTPYHLCWTAMAEKDYDAAYEDDADRDKPAGEKNNVYKVDHILHLRRDDEGIPVGDLEKSGLVQHRFVDLESPTFDDLGTVVRDVEEAELADGEVNVDEVTDYDIGVVKGNPRLL